MSGQKFNSIDDLVDNIERNYKGSEVDGRYNDKYRVVSVGEGTIESIIKRLGNFSGTEIIYLIVEKIDG